MSDSGPDTLRKLVNWLNNTTEDLIQRFTAKELLQLYKCYKRSDWDYTLDYWTDRQIQQALIFDETPSWDENGKAVYGET